MQGMGRGGGGAVKFTQQYSTATHRLLPAQVCLVRWEELSVICRTGMKED